MARNDPHRHLDAADADAGAVETRARFDKWLWAARFYKTRTLAAQAIDAGQARLNHERVKPAHAVKTGDAITIRKHATVWELRVAAIGERRGSATDAAKLYAETPESAAARAEEVLRRQTSAVAEPRFPGRPTKRQRRKLEDFLNEP